MLIVLSFAMMAMANAYSSGPPAPPSNGAQAFSMSVPNIVPAVPHVIKVVVPHPPIAPALPHGPFPIYQVQIDKPKQKRVPPLENFGLPKGQFKPWRYLTKYGKAVYAAPRDPSYPHKVSFIQQNQPWYWNFDWRPLKLPAFGAATFLILLWLSRILF